MLSRISEKPLQEVFKMMQTCFLERNPLITRKLAALRITEPKEEQISDCLHRSVESYKSAYLDLAPLETRCLLHLITLLASDSLSEKIKDFSVKKMRITPSIE